MNASPASVVSARKLGLTFHTSDGPVHALSDVDLEVEKGDFVSFIGPSGCGKTTLLRVIADLEKPTSGAISINGMTPEQARESRAYGYVFQASALLPWRTIERNVALPLEVMGVAKPEQGERIRRTLELVNLSGFEKKYPWQLSGGMQQRASIARALVHDPKLILIDEPYGALDALTRERMNLELLRIWRESRKTIVFVTHGIAEAVFLGSRVIVLTAGPARMADNFTVELPHPRTLDLKTHERFGDYTRRIYKLLGME